jgi:DNA polymerase-3 subunit epsilon
MQSLDRLAYVDIETTGTRPTRDRITEIAIVLVDQHKIVKEWSTLLNPQTFIPVHIQQLTGITPLMTQNAPTFEDMVDEIESILSDRIFIAHNAKFDYGFIKNEFARVGKSYSSPVACTVRLSRSMSPNQRRHNLDTLLAVHNIKCEHRHRALDDARALPLIVQSLIQKHGGDRIELALQSQLRHRSLPANISQEQLDHLPQGPGVYLFYGENKTLLYIGKSINIQQRVKSHFSSVHHNDREMRISQQLRDIDWIETAGELGALLLEAKLIKKHQPLFNQRLRRNKQLFSLYWDANEASIPSISDHRNIEAIDMANLYGLFRSRRQMQEALRKIAKSHRLCLKLLGLEKGPGACFAYQLGNCRGACIGKEPEQKHRLRMQTALLPMRLKSWPYEGVIGIHERNESNGLEETHVIYQWHYLGKMTQPDNLEQVLRDSPVEALDIDIYRLLVKHLNKHQPVLLTRDNPFIPS